MGVYSNFGVIRGDWPSNLHIL